MKISTKVTLYGVAFLAMSCAQDNQNTREGSNQNNYNLNEEHRLPDSPGHSNASSEEHSTSESQGNSHRLPDSPGHSVVESGNHDTNTSAGAYK